jgi:hypothetical protein
MRLVLVLQWFSSRRDSQDSVQLQRYVSKALQLKTGFGGQGAACCPLSLWERARVRPEAGTRFRPLTPTLSPAGEREYCG